MKNGGDLGRESKVSGLLLEAAGEVFADQGFHGATIRKITSRAGVNIAAVNYYFKDKDELYGAVLRHVHQFSLKDKAWEELEGELAEDRLCRFISTLFRQSLDPERPKWHGVLISRELARPTAIFQQMLDDGFRPRCILLTNAVQKVAGVPLPPKRLQMIVAGIISQCLFYRHSRAVAEQLFPKVYEGKDWIKELAEYISNLTILAIRAECGRSC